MITAGVDSGFQNTKVVILHHRRIIGQVCVPNGRQPAGVVAQRALTEALGKAGISGREIGKTIATGAGKGEIPFEVEEASEARCLVAGANFLLPSTKAVVDLGAYKSMAVRCNGVRLIRVAKSTKCAASSGIYLERLASVLHLKVEEMGPLSRSSTQNVEVLGSCAVFGETAVISLLHLKKEVPDILRGIFESFAHQIHPLLADVGVEPDMVICGGVAKNTGVVDALKHYLKIDISVPDQPDTLSALGAAIIGQATGERSK